MLFTHVTETRTIHYPLADVWATLLFMSSSAALYATLTAPRRINPDTSLAIELFASVSLTVLLGYLSWTIANYVTPSGNFAATSFGMTAIFVLGFGARALQIVFERRSLRKYRNPPATDTIV
jgi:uncharacterized membrane protein YbhN (UPF0104 family)